jgi:putative ABC transport system permease protein
MIQVLHAYFVLAFSNIWQHKVRAFLSMLGILVGTASVVALLMGGSMATNNALAQFKTLGTNLLSMNINDKNYQANTNQVTRQFQLSDVPELNSASPLLHITAPYITTYGTTIFRTKTLNASIIGATSNLYRVLHLSAKKGRLVTELDKGENYCVIGTALAKKLQGYGALSVIGEQIEVGNIYYTIVGILNKTTPNFFFFTNLNNGIIIPLSNTYELNNNANINNIIFRTAHHANFTTLQMQLTNKMALMLPNKRVNFYSPKQILSVMGKQRTTFTWLLAMIGAISLLVGGIGVMNVMLMSVMERRQEIGIRIAVGAKQRNILMMFLSEAILQTMMGGILGVLLGIVISYIVALIAHWAFAFFFTPPLVAFVVSLIVGILAGFYPALRASKLDPIVTLRTA